MEEVYSATLQKQMKLEQLGLKYVCIWSHQWEDIAKNPEVKTFLSTLDLTSRLDPRESFFGGR